MKQHQVCSLNSVMSISIPSVIYKRKHRTHISEITMPEDIAYDDRLPELPAGTTAPTTTGITSKKNELRGPLLSSLLSTFVLGCFYVE